MNSYIKIMLLISFIGFFFSCSEPLQNLNQDDDSNFIGRQSCNPTESTIVDGCCIKADALPAFPGQESSIDFGDGTIIILNINSSMEHCYEEAGTYVVISTLKDDKGQIIFQHCEEFIVKCISPCELVSIEYEEIASSNEYCCKYIVTVNNPTDTDFTLIVDGVGSPDEYLIPATSEVILDEELTICFEQAVLELTSNSASEECSKTFFSPKCNACCKEAQDKIEIDYCLDRSIDSECCFVKFEFTNFTDCTVALLDNNDPLFIALVYAGQPYYRIVNTCDKNDFYIASNMSGNLCINIELPSCKELEECR